MSVYDLTTEIKTVFSSNSVEKFYQAAHAQSESKLRPSKASNHTTANYLRSPDKGASVLCVPRSSHYANGKNRYRLFIFLPSKLGIEQMNKIPGIIKISY